jgi:uncharacterized protein involved in cysteine biosynthesis
LHVRIFWFELLADHASKDERQQILMNNWPQLLVLGAVLALLLSIPIFNFVIPVYGSLVFGRFCLFKLKELRG